MSILVFIDQADGQIKKASYEAASYAAETAKLMGSSAIAVVIGNTQTKLDALGQYGINKVYHFDSQALNVFNSSSYAKVIQEIATTVSAEVIVFTNNTTGKAIAPALSVRMKAGLVSGAVALPDLNNGFVVKKSVFSGKAFANVKILSAQKIISINSNSFGVIHSEGTAEVIASSTSVTSAGIEITGTQKITGEIPLGEADIVVSGGRGLKGPENWGLVTELASLLGAATACSRPVADIHWRPHHEHVGQTGLAIAPNLYIAIGISGAIQHLAGVNRSKTIVVINKDPEAPFFKAADYGIIGDAFEVVPKIIDSVKKLKSL
jgi:electron transfer flavoprotein alpha subunit